MKEFDCFAAQQDLCCEMYFFFSFKISCNYNESKAMLNDLIVLGVIARIFFSLCIKKEAAVEKKN